MTPNELLDGRPVAVIGAGLVGAGWAILFARAGLDVRVYDANRSATDVALSLIAEQLQELNYFGLIGDPDEVTAHLTQAYSLADAVDGAARIQGNRICETDDCGRALAHQDRRIRPAHGADGLSIAGWRGERD